MDLHWEEGFTIDVRVINGTAVVRANREGLLSLANHLRTLAEAPAGSHIHLDQGNALEDGSTELILERTE